MTMIEAADAVDRPLKMRSAGRALTRVDPDPEDPDPRVDPPDDVRSLDATPFGRFRTAVFSLTVLFLEGVALGERTPVGCGAGPT
ncbi:hypothetical protein ACFJGV_17360 [Cnuibacter sp. UC19_7]|uniref:hypothetical protein n=1 Tax=Cnuibacter sp. UC19_7 TaxID=3350166 RepID=UPI0036703D9C